MEEQRPIGAAAQVDLTGAMRGGSGHTDGGLPAFHLQVEGRLAVGVDKAADVLHRIPELAPTDAFPCSQKGAIGKGGSHPAVQLDVSRVVVSPQLWRQSPAAVAKAESLGPLGYCAGVDPHHAFAHAVLVKPHEILLGGRSLEEAQVVRPVAVDAQVEAVVDGPTHGLIFARQFLPTLVAAVHRDLVHRQDEFQLARRPVGAARSQHSVGPVFVVEGKVRRVLDARSDGEVALAAGQVDVHPGPQAVVGGAVSDRHRHPVAGRDGGVGPGHSRLVAVLLHRQAPLHASGGQPPALLRRPPTGGLEDGVLIELVVAGRFEDALVDAPSQFRQHGQSQILVFHDQRGKGPLGDRFGRAVISPPIQPLEGHVVGAVVFVLQIVFVRIGGDSDAGNGQGGGQGGRRGGQAAGDVDSALVHSLIQGPVVGDGLQSVGTVAVLGGVQHQLVGGIGGQAQVGVVQVELDPGQTDVVVGCGLNVHHAGHGLALCRVGDLNRRRFALGAFDGRVAVGHGKVLAHLGHRAAQHADVAHVHRAQTGLLGQGQVADGGRVVADDQGSHRVHGHRVAAGHDQFQGRVGQVIPRRAIGQPTQTVHHHKVHRAAQVEVHDVAGEVGGVVGELGLEHRFAGGVVDVVGGDADHVLQSQGQPGEGVVLQHRHTDEDVGVEDGVGDPVLAADQPVGQGDCGDVSRVLGVGVVAADVEVNQGDAGDVVHHVVVAVVARDVEGGFGGEAIVLARHIDRRAFGDEHLACPGLLGQPDHGAGHAGVGHLAVLWEGVPDQVGLDDHGVAGFDDVLQPTGQRHCLAHHSLHLVVRRGRAVAFDDGYLGDA